MHDDPSFAQAIKLAEERGGALRRAVGEDFVHGSLIGTTFTGRLVGTAMVGDFRAVVPTVRERAWLPASGTTCSTRTIGSRPVS